MLNLLTTFFLFIFISALKNTTFYIGENYQNSQVIEFDAFPDFLYNTTIISSNDFECTLDYNCEISSASKELEYQDQKITYQDAIVQINIIKTPFTKRLMIKYIKNDTQNFGSIIGFSKNSEFLNYLYQEDKKKGYQIIMRIDWENNLIFKDGIYETDKLPVNYKINSKFYYPHNMHKEERVMTFCYSNRVDIDTENYTYFSMKKSLYEEIEPELLTFYQSLKDQDKNLVPNFASEDSDPNSIKIKLFDEEEEKLGNLYLMISEIFRDNNQLMTFFDDDFDEDRGCDIYSSTLLHKKYNFKYYYIEYSQNFSVKWGFDNYHGDEERGIHFWPIFKFILVFLILVFIVVAIYFYYYKEEQREEEFYEELQPQRPSDQISPTRHQQNQNNQFKLKKTSL